MSIATKLNSNTRGRHKQVRNEMNPELKREAAAICASIRSWCYNGCQPSTQNFDVRNIRTPDDYYGLLAAVDRAIHGYDCAAQLPEDGETRLKVVSA